MNGRRFAIGAWMASFGLLGLLGTGHASGYFLNTTESLPRGVWRTVGAPVLLDGHYVTATLADTSAIKQLREWGYLDHRRLLKPIGAVPGDVVDVSHDGISVNGRLLSNTLQLIHDGPGHVLPRVAVGRYVVAPGTVWLISQYNPISLDSRYFGPVSVASLINEARPVFVRQGPPEDEAAAEAAVKQAMVAQQAPAVPRAPRIEANLVANLGAPHAH